jgi:hypothetical protein
MKRSPNLDCFNIYLQPKFDMSSFNSSLFIAIRQKAKYKSRAISVLFYALKSYCILFNNLLPRTISERYIKYCFNFRRLHKNSPVGLNVIRGQANTRTDMPP